MNLAGPDPEMSDMLSLSVRETRMIIERILLVAGIPQGLLCAVRDCVVYSQAAGLGGLRTLKRDFDVLQQAKPQSLSVKESKEGAVKLDCADQHAWIAASAALDLALAHFRAGAGGRLHVQDVRAPEEMKVIEALAERYRAKVQVASTGLPADVEVCVIADGMPGEDAILRGALLHGLPVPRSLWRELYEWSHQALSPDSIVSRRHAGPVMVDAEGRIHGRDDDDTDFALLVGSKDESGRVQEEA